MNNYRVSRISFGGVGGGMFKKPLANPHSSVIPLCAFLSLFTLSFITGSLIITPRPSKATTGLGLVTTPTMSLTSSGNINLPITPTPSGTLVSTSHNLSASTNVPTGYNLTLSTPATSTLPTTTSTFASPSPLANNTWGYALASTGNFDPNYTIPTPPATSKWANPTEGATIKSTTNSVTSDNTTVYYGAKVDTTQASGTYLSTIRYTATSNTSSIPTPTITSITPNSGTTAGGTQVTIIGTGFTINDESVTTAINLDNLSCTSVAISSNTPTTGQDTITCNTPPHAAGAVDVAVTTWRSTATTVNGYTYIAPASVTFVSPNQASTIAGTESGPAFTIVGSNFTGATSVTIGGTACQSFEIISNTHIFCKAPNTINTTGSKTIAVTKSGVSGTSSAGVAYNNTAYPTLQSSSAYANCTTTAKLYRDIRDSQLYYVKKMPDNKCWMVDNLKYANYGDLSQETNKYLTVDGTSTQSTANSDVAKYVDPGATDYCKGNTSIPTNTNTRCGLQYNWYTATNGAGTYAQSTQGTNVTGNICPANFRLPSATSDGLTATGNGTSYNAADFAVLNASMNAGTLTTPGVTTASYYADWQPAGAWGGTFSGGWANTLGNTGSFGFFWSSTANSATRVHALRFTSSGVYPNNGTYDKYYGFAVRCVMEQPTPTPPAGSNPSNIISTNPQVLDVYPTTGWAGDTVAITSNALFTNVSSVTIGGTACTKFGVITTSLITCTLPAKTAGTTNDIAVTNNGTNITPASTYNHMRITYFNPSSSTVNIGGTNYTFYPNGFTSANCSAMIASDAAITATPAISMVYARDARNNQTYKVKKMADGKCWMVDNLKYADSNMTFNNGDHLNNGGTTAYNTIDESSTQSDTNSNKAFYNNPTSNNYCYIATAMPANSLTRCGYLYNWYAATNGAGTYAQSTAGTNVTGNICPANFRLPSGTSDGTTAIGNGTSSIAADLPVLNASMNAGSLTTGSTTSSYQAGWQPSGAWGGTFSGRWSNGLGDMGSSGNFWSSTVTSATLTRLLYFNRGVVIPGSSYVTKSLGQSIRCIVP